MDICMGFNRVRCKFSGFVQRSCLDGIGQFGGSLPKKYPALLLTEASFPMADEGLVGVQKC